ncbi:MAG: GIY-YIG nuclease family protein [Gemmatimonadales bacterium]
MARQYYVYMMTNPRRTALYTGVTNDLLRRVWQHRNGAGGGFTKRYHCSQIVLYEVFMDSYNAIAREKQIKAGPRRRKVELIERMNPEWRDLYDELWGCTPRDCFGPSGSSQ